MGEQIKALIDRYIKTQGSAVGVSSKLDDILKAIIDLISNGLTALSERIDALVPVEPWLISESVFLIDHNPKTCTGDEIVDYTGHTLEEWIAFITGKKPIDVYIDGGVDLLIKASNLSYEDDTFQMGYVHGEDNVNITFTLAHEGTGEGINALTISYSGHTDQDGGDNGGGAGENPDAGGDA